MPQPTNSDLYDNQTTLINSVAWDAPTKTLSIAFSQEVSPLQSFAAIVQSGHKWLLANQDLAVNASASAANINSTNRNGQVKEMTALSIQFYTPLPDITFDPLQL